ncbi:MAG: alpha/beta fold hydrolase, partial [Spirulinaceae cyanobacterium]
LNAPRLTVISGTAQGIEDSVAAFKAKQIKTKVLNVSHAFHSPLMQPMLAEFEQLARRIEYHPPQIPLISNLTGEFVTAEIATPDYWCRHILEPVRFAQSMQVLEAQKYNCFLEIGAKSTLLAMGRQCVSSEGLWLPSLHPEFGDTEQMLSSLQQLYENGASIDWAAFDHPFSRPKIALPTYPFQRQRYWLEALDRQESGTLRLPDWFYQVEYEQLPITNDQLLITNKEQTTNNKFLIFCSESETDFAETLAASCQKQGGSSEIVVLDEAPQAKSPFEQFFEELTQPVTHIIYVSDRADFDNLALDAISNAQKQAHIGLLHLVQALSDRPQSPTPQLWLITHQAQSLQPQERINLIAASLWGMGRTIALELPQLWGGMVDLDTESRDSDEAIAAILHPQGENQIVLRQNKCYVPRLRSQSPPVSTDLPIRSNATYLITGGLGSLGLKTAQWLIAKGATSLVLTGRNAPQNNAKIAALKAQGAKITCIAADVADPKAVAQLFAKIASLPTLRGIIHAAGILADNAIAQQTASQFEQVFAPKGLGAWNLHAATLDYDLDFFVLYSSIAAILGSPGQSNYAAANGFLDGLARDRAALGLPALSINWSAWGQGGMAQQQEKRLVALGLKPLAPNLAVNALAGAISSQDSQKLVIDADWQKVAFSDGEIPPLLRDLVQLPETEETPSSPWLERLKTASPDQQIQILQDYLQRQIAKALHLQPQQIKRERNLLDLGLDSLMLMETINQLKNDFQLLLYPREFYERPRLDALAEYIAAEFNRSHNPTDALTATDSEVTLTLGSNTLETAPTLERKLDPAVFILSSPRAGSTLLRVMLAGHSQLFSPPELHLLPFATMTERERELALSNLDEGLVRSLMELFELDADEAIALTAEMSHSGLSIPDVYAKLQAGAQPRLLVDKSPTYALNRAILDRAEAWFEKAKYIHLIRHPYAVVESFTRLRMEKLFGDNSGNPYGVAEQVWRTCNQNILDFGQTVDDRYLLVYYENLVKQPEVEMRRICQFLDLPWSEAVLQPYKGDRMTDGTQRSSLSIGDPNFKQRRQLDPSLADIWQTIELPRPLNAKTQALAQRFDYPLPDQAKPQLGKATMQEQFIEVRGQKLCVCTWGNPENPPVLLLHGILEQGAAWQQTAQSLAAQGYWCIAPDLRGHGRSDYAPGETYRLLDFLGDLDVLAQTLNLQPSLVVGHSLGSAIAAMWTSARPSRVKSLILVEPVLPVENRTDISAQLTAHLDNLHITPQHPVFPNLEVAAKRLQAGSPALSDDFALFLAQRHTEPWEGGWRWRWDVRLSDRSSFGFGGLPFDRSQYLQLLQNLACPITLIYGDRSTFNRPEDLAAQQQAMASARRFQLLGGHNLHLDTPDDLADIIAEAAILGSGQ